MSSRKILIAILLVAALLRFWGLGRGDPVNDEVFYAFRGLGMMDFDLAEHQTTPWEWFDPHIPSWTYLSFHDHPPLVFYIEHIFLRAFGEHNTSFRLPSALLGIASVFFLYRIGTFLYTSRVGLLAAAILAVTLNHVYISRVGMQEAYVIFFLLLASLFFLKSLTDERYWIPTGIVLGLGFLTKFTFFIAPIIFIAYLALRAPRYFKNKKLWIGALCSVILFSPVIIYNLMLWRATGHLDFQFSFLFGQHPEVWRDTPGKDIGTLSYRIAIFIPRLISTNSWLFLTVFAATLIGFLASLRAGARAAIRHHGFLIITLALLTLFLLFIGPSFRFLTMLTPFMALTVALGLNAFFEKYFTAQRTLALILLGFFLLFETAYAINNEIVYYPKGPQPWFSSAVRYENYNWGYNALETFMEREVSGKMPALTFDLKYQFLDTLRDDAVAQGLKDNKEPYPALFVTYGNFDHGAKLWVLDRFHIYHAWPIIDWDTYQQYLHEQGSDYYQRTGFRYFYFIATANIVPTPEFRALVRNAEMTRIFNPRGEEVFVIYKLVVK